MGNTNQERTGRRKGRVQEAEKKHPEWGESPLGTEDNIGNGVQCTETSGKKTLPSAQCL